MTTTSQLQSWCTDHGYSVTQHFAMLPSMNFDWLKIGFWAAVAALAYIVGRVGLPTFWSDLKSIYASIRNHFSGSTTTTTTASGGTSGAGGITTFNTAAGTPVA